MKAIQKINPILLLAAALVLLIVSWRGLMGGSNFAPVAAIALLSGYLIKDRKIALMVPLLGMMISDLLFAGVYHIGVMLAVYISFALPVLWGASNWFRATGTWLSPVLNTIAKAVAASAAFYMLSNLAVFLFTPMYGFNLSGLAQCYINALPFLRPTLLGDLAFAGLGFGLVMLWKVFSVKTRLIRI